MSDHMGGVSMYDTHTAYSLTRFRYPKLSAHLPLTCNTFKEPAGGMWGILNKPKKLTGTEHHSHTNTQHNTQKQDEPLPP